MKTVRGSLALASSLVDRYAASRIGDHPGQRDPDLVVAALEILEGALGLPGLRGGRPGHGHHQRQIAIAIITSIKVKPRWTSRVAVDRRVIYGPPRRLVVARRPRRRRRRRARRLVGARRLAVPPLKPGSTLSMPAASVKYATQQQLARRAVDLVADGQRHLADRGVEHLLEQLEVARDEIGARHVGAVVATAADATGAGAGIPGVPDSAVPSPCPP
jgi:hypothetical protein